LYFIFNKCFKSNAKFWQLWKDFEIAHGNEDTVREMLRIKRSVQATYNVQVNFMSAQMIAASSAATGQLSAQGFYTKILFFSRTSFNSK
jgi:hypothetical protein